MDAIAVGGSGALAQSIGKAVKGVGTDVAFELLASGSGEVGGGQTSIAFRVLTDEAGNAMYDAAGNVLMSTVGEVTITASASTVFTAGISGPVSAGIVSQVVHGNSVNSTRPTQVYEHIFESGKTYTGVGDTNGNRASQSARKISRKYNDPLLSTKTTNLPTRSQAYGVEQVRIEMNGGAKNFKKNYNRRNSPGLKIIKKLFR